MIVCDEKSLKVQCEEIKDLEKEGIPLTDKLHKELSASRIEGIGLAAVQIGVPKRAFVMQIPYHGFKLAHSFINPKIVLLEDPVVFKEGCLSFPGKEVETLRYNRLIIEDALEPNGRTFIGLASVCAQHEFDHTCGLTMFDRLLKDLKLDSACPCGSEKTFKKCCKDKIRKFK